MPCSCRRTPAWNQGFLGALASFQLQADTRKTAGDLGFRLCTLTCSPRRGGIAGWRVPSWEGTPGFLEGTSCGLLCCGSQVPPSSGGSQSLSRGSLAPAYPHWAGRKAPGRGWRLLPWTGGTWVAARRRTWTHSTMTTRLSATGASSLLPWPSSWGSLSSSVKDSAVEAKRSTGKSMRMICNDRVSGAPRAGGPFGKPSLSW
ncbi:hypothetical protein VULLAG_LOCUS21635 [Vulpes lagopus]